MSDERFVDIENDGYSDFGNSIELGLTFKSDFMTLLLLC